ncbi:MAG TPA: Rieske (2Fe-2S) protein [Edaphobacter sp.]|nr:Rieske (2Fe-2S) protein [Edaphobacter sp.]
MAQWVRLCGLQEAPAEGKVVEAEAEGREICLANVNGKLAALDNICPHRQGPLGQGWIEGNSVVCPWHSWTFDCKTGESGYPPNHRVDVVPLRIEGDDVLVDVERQLESSDIENTIEIPGR